MCVSSVCGRMPNRDKLREYAATIMARLEDTYDIAVDIQEHGRSLTDTIKGFQTIQGNLNAIEKIAYEAVVLASKSDSS